MNLRRLRTATRETAAGALQLIASATIARGDLVHRIHCGRCRTWVKPSRYNPRLYACTDCATSMAIAARLHVITRARYVRAYTRKLANVGK